MACFPCSFSKWPRYRPARSRAASSTNATSCHRRTVSLLSDEVVHDVVNIGEGSPPSCYHVSSEVSVYVFLPVKMGEALRPNALLDDRQIAFVPELVLIPAHDSFVLFR